MNIKTNSVIVVGLILLLTTSLLAREKTENIGKFSWYTEQNTFEEMVQIAQKANKPILAVFSATWCGPCQRVKKGVFKTDDFKRVADKVVLFYVEQTTEEGAAYNKTYNVKSWPTFKIFSQQGIMLDTGTPERTVDGFLEWIDDVKAGNNFYEYSKKLEKNPNDRETLVKIVDKMGRSEKDKKISMLKKAIKINPDFNDELSQKAYEKLASFLMQNIPYREGKEKTAYLNDNHQLLEDVFNAYYPDKFKYQLKGDQSLADIINWFNQSKKFAKALSFFDDFLKQKGEKLDLVKDIGVISSAIPTYIGQGNTTEADNWIMKVRESSKDTEALKKNRGFFYNYLEMFTAMVEHFGKKGEIKEAEKYAALLFDEMSRLGQERMKKYLMPHYASRYGILPDKALEYIEEKLKTVKGTQVALLTITKAQITAKQGKKEESRKLLVELYENKEYLKSLNSKELVGILNGIAWTMVELKIADQKSLEIAKEAVSLNPSAGIMDTLASVHAELGNFKEAVKIEKEALEKLEKESQKKEYTEKIKEWEKKI